MSRSRSNGSRYPVSVSMSATRVEARRTPQWTIEYRDVPVTGTFYTNYDDRCSIGDVVGFFDTFNSVSHTKRRTSAVLPSLKSARYMAPGVQPSWLGRDYWTLVGYQCSDTPNISVSVLGMGDGNFPVAAYPSIDWAEVVDQVGVQLDGRMTVGQNLLVSLVQISQTIGMVKNPFNVRKLAQAKWRNKPLSSLLSKSSGAYLEYRYGWLNFKRDIEQLSNVWREVRDHMQYLKDTEHRYTSLSASQTDTYTHSSSQSFAFGSEAFCAVRARFTSSRRTARFSTDVQRDQQAMLWSKLDHISSRLGTTELAEALWDLVPWSFVVDWFTHVNRFVRQGPIMWNSADLRRTGWSIKEEHFAEIKLTSRAATSYGFGPLSEVTLDPHLVGSTYQRTPGFPPSTQSVGLFGNLTKTQMADGVALVVQKIVR